MIVDQHGTLRMNNIKISHPLPKCSVAKSLKIGACLGTYISLP